MDVYPPERDDMGMCIYGVVRPSTRTQGYIPDDVPGNEPDIGTNSPVRTLTYDVYDSLTVDTTVDRERSYTMYCALT